MKPPKDQVQVDGLLLGAPEDIEDWEVHTEVWYDFITIEITYSDGEENSIKVGKMRYDRESIEESIRSQMKSQ